MHCPLEGAAIVMDVALTPLCWFSCPQDCFNLLQTSKLAFLKALFPPEVDSQNARRQTLVLLIYLPASSLA